ncbi:hypothetical protein A9168_09555 [Macellibacteroides sp. HH-ZS]|nr:hypothetical protein A9168_09555 [Macellibacteroides sp. HH-ZS]
MIKWFKRLLKKILHIENDLSICNEEAFFKSIIVTDKTPNEDSLKENDFVEVVYRNQSYWAIFICPCGCKNVITLPLQKYHNPHWQLEHSTDNKPTLYPSIWQNNGCLSHFWIKNGKIEWCNNSGFKPCITEPKHFKKYNYMNK